MNWKLYFFILILLTGCTTEQEANSEYIIESELDGEIRLEFYRNGSISTKISPVNFSGRGQLLKKKGDKLGSTASPFDVFLSDSIVIIFGNERLEGHNFFTPTGSSLLNQNDYQKVGDDRYLYIITEKNLNNALPCDGPCR